MDETIVCQGCTYPIVEPEYTMPLCASCRDSLSRRPLPGWIKTSLLVVVAVVLLSGWYFYVSLNSGIAFELGRRAEKRGDLETATAEDRQVAKRFPKSTLVRCRLVVALWRAGQLDEAIDELEHFEGSKIPKDLHAEQGRSFIPIVINIVASDPGEFRTTINIWGDALTRDQECVPPSENE
jgi:hypothetical protein